MSSAAKQFPERVQIATESELNSTEAVKQLLRFVGLPDDAQVRSRPLDLQAPKPHPRLHVRTTEPHNPQRCVVLVPYGSHILPETEVQLRELEQLGYCVRRQGGISAIDQGRSQMATDALIDGFEETMWIDSDVQFNAEDVTKLRRHGEPIVSGLYPKKEPREFASHFLPNTPGVTFGTCGGLIEIQYAATGFLLVRREVYCRMQWDWGIIMCNELFKSRPTVPFFQPMCTEHLDSWWSLGEDYSFSHRARDCGYRILADTSIRLWHIGNYHYGWEDTGTVLTRFEYFVMKFE